MKNFRIHKKLIFLGCIAFVGFLSSCSMFDDFLTVYPTNQVTGEQFWEDKNDLTSVVASCYRQLTTEDVIKRIEVWGEVRSDNLILKSMSDEDMLNIMNANLLPTNKWYNWAAFYKGIGFCNLVLSKGDEVMAKDPSFTESDWKPIAAECKTLRALYYFYLIKAFRDVPFNIKPSDTSDGARDPMPQIPSQTILTYLINDLEGCKDDGMTNYGNAVSNHCRITKDAIYTLLADMYLWRASKNTCADSTAKYPGMAKSDYAKCIEYCDYVIADKIKDFQKEKVEYYGELESSKTPQPLYVPTTAGRTEDVPYDEVFGTGTSLESIFEIAFDGTNNSNSLVSTFFGSVSGTTVTAGSLGGSSIFQQTSDLPDQQSLAYSKTDLRSVSAIQYLSSVTSDIANSQIIKYLATSIEVLDATDVRKAESGKADNVNYGGYRSSSNMNADWLVYRVSDVLLMKAEAIACSYSDGDPMLEEGFKAAYAVFDRSNPAATSDQNISFDSYKTSSNLLAFVMRERQREFFGEGKRWFDLVRKAMRDNTTEQMLNLLAVKYSTNASAVKAKLATLNSLYSPVFKDEMKINPALVQNPAWVIDETIVRH